MGMKGSGGNQGRNAGANYRFPKKVLPGRVGSPSLNFRILRRK